MLKKEGELILFQFEIVSTGFGKYSPCILVIQQYTAIPIYLFIAWIFANFLYCWAKLKKDSKFKLKCGYFDSLIDKFN